MAVRKKRSISIPPELDAEIAAAAEAAGLSYSAWIAQTARKEFVIRAPWKRSASMKPSMAASPRTRSPKPTSGLPGSPSPPPPGGRREALPSDLERLRASLSELPIQELSQRLLGSLQAIERLANHLDARVEPLLGSVGQGFETATRTMEVVKTVIGQLQPEVSHALADTDALVTDTRHQIDDRSADIAHLVQSADRVTQQANVLVSTLNNLAEPRSEFRGNLDASMRDIAATAASMRELARALDRDPSVVLRGRSGQ